MTAIIVTERKWKPRGIGMDGWSKVPAVVCGAGADTPDVAVWRRGWMLQGEVCIYYVQDRIASLRE